MSTELGRYTPSAIVDTGFGAVANSIELGKVKKDIINEENSATLGEGRLGMASANAQKAATEDLATSYQEAAAATLTQGGFGATAPVLAGVGSRLLSQDVAGNDPQAARMALLNGATKDSVSASANQAAKKTPQELQYLADYDYRKQPINETVLSDLRSLRAIKDTPEGKDLYKSVLANITAAKKEYDALKASHSASISTWENRIQSTLGQGMGAAFSSISTFKQAEAIQQQAQQQALQTEASTSTQMMGQGVQMLGKGVDAMDQAALKGQEALIEGVSRANASPV